MITTLLWDHDGVLVDTERLYFRATREALASVDVHLSEEQYRALFLVGGGGAWHLAEERGVPATTLAALKAQRNARYTELLLSEEVLLPDAMAALTRLSSRFRMAIVTSSRRDHFDAIHQRSGLPGFFELILTREDYVESKPNPEPYLTALHRLGVSPEESLVIEDSERGLRAARAAGLRCWAIPSELTRHSDFSAAERVFESRGALFSGLAAL